MRISLLCLLLIIIQIGFGQTDFGSVKGHLNYTKDEPAKFFLVELKNTLQQIVKQTYTFDDGSFYFDSIAVGTYTVNIPYQDTSDKGCIKIIRNTAYIEKIRVTKYAAAFVDITLINRIIVEYITICPPRFVLNPPRIDINGRFNGTIVREDIYPSR